MRPWQMLWKAEALLMAVMVVGGSSAPPTPRVQTGARGGTVIHIQRTATVEPVEVAPEEVTEILQRLARQVRLSGTPRETVERLFQPKVPKPLSERAREPV